MKTIKYDPSFCQAVLQFFDCAPFCITEVQKKDGTLSLLETAAELPTFAAFAKKIGVTCAELPTFAAFAKKIGVTCAELRAWEEKHAAFRYACEQARERQGNILIQNALRGNYAASFAVFAAKNLLGWKDGKDAPEAVTPVVIQWENSHD